MTHGRNMHRASKWSQLQSRLARAALVIAACCLTSTGSGSAQAESQDAVPVPSLLLGAAWYPEQWPESRWAADVDLMQKAHLHVTRVGEFAWTAMEPAEGRYD